MPDRPTVGVQVPARRPQTPAPAPAPAPSSEPSSGPGDLATRFPFVFGAERFTIFCDAPMCQRSYDYWSQQSADTHYRRTHADRQHWAYIKPTPTPEENPSS